MTDLDLIANQLYQAKMEAHRGFAYPWTELPAPGKEVWRRVARVAQSMGMEAPEAEVRPWQERERPIPLRVVKQRRRAG